MSLSSCTVLITTKNRKNELRNALVSVSAQSIACKILVLDDGSTDETQQMVLDEFPQVRVHREETSLGVIRARNRGVELADTEIVVTIDDDCVLSSPSILSQTLQDLAPRAVAAVTMPLINVNDSPRVIGRAPDRERVWLAPQFQGGANAVKRSVFLRAGGMRGEFNRQCEETDLSLRLLGLGYVVRFGNCEPVLHYESPVRDRSKIIYYQTRNNLLVLTLNVPLLMLPLHMASTLVNGSRAGIRAGYAKATMHGLGAAIYDSIRYFGKRQPVSMAAYSLFRRLRQNARITLDDARALLDLVPE